MKLLALEKDVPGIADSAFTEEILQQEAARAWELHQAGVIRELHFRADRHAAVLVLECTSVAEAEEVLHTLPLMQHGLIDFEIIPLKAYPGFARLFNKTAGLDSH
jgi:muconolactone delta-isomerase